MSKIMELASSKEWDKVLEILKNNSPIFADDFMREYFGTHKNAYFPLEEWTEEQEKAFRELASRKYRIEYYLKKGEDNLTEEEWQDFKACEG